jgi:hypothetical protein
MPCYLSVQRHLCKYGRLMRLSIYVNYVSRALRDTPFLADSHPVVKLIAGPNNAREMATIFAGADTLPSRTQ